MDKRLGWIYGLYDAEVPSRVRYVGRTISRGGVAERVYHHKWAAQKLRANVPSANWIRKIGPGRVRYFVIEETTEDRVNEREIHWISEFRDRGLADLNILSGGEGLDSESVSGEKNPKAVLNWPLVRTLRVEASLRYLSVAENAKKYGMTPAAMSKVLKNQSWHDPEYDPTKRLRIAEANATNSPAELIWRTLTDLEVESMREMYLEGRSVSEIVRVTGQAATSVIRCLFEKYGSEESRRKCVDRRPPVKPRKPPIPADIRRSLLDRYYAGEHQSDLAKEVGITQSAIAYWVQRDKMK